MTNNNQRANRAEIALMAYWAFTDSNETEILADLLTDLMHWTDKTGVDFAEALNMADDHYATETEEETE